MLAKFNGTTADELTAFVLNTITTINKPTLFERLCELSEILAASDIENYLVVSNKECCLIYAENSHLAVVDDKFFRYNSGAIKKIAKKHEKGTYGFKLVIFDLYEVIISMLEEKKFLEKCFDFEKTKGFSHITKSIESAFRFSGEKNLLVEYIKENTPDNSVVFLTGIGKCYPILRSHNILNNLHQVMDKVPVVMFYPGKYDGQELILFSELKDHNYYRAFRLVD